MEYKRVILDGRETHLLIYEDGRLYSEKSHRFLKAQVNNVGYAIYNLTWLCGRCYLAHTLVAIHFIGPCPLGKTEINHKDLDKRNNHWSNLEWVTHSYNILHARGVKHWEPGRRGFKHGVSTIQKMAKAKYKPVKCIKGDEEMVFGSIEEFLNYFKTYRKKFNRTVNSIKTIDGWSIRYA